MSMKAVQIEEYGSPDVLKYHDISDPVPGDGEAVVDVQAVGVNFTDTYTRAGVNPAARLPWTIGVEGAGVVREVGKSVSEVSEGDEVVFCTVPGCYAERVLVPSWRLVKRPTGLDAKMGAAVMLQGMTAHYLCYSTYPVQRGDKVLIHAGAGGTGLLLTQMVKQLGGYVFSTVSTEAKAELSREAGADHVILYTQQDFAEEVKQATGGEGVQVVYDSVGKTTFDQSLSCLARRGLMVLYGAASGPPAPMDSRALAGGSLYLTRPGLGDYTTTRPELEKRSGDIFGWVKSGELKLRIDHVFPLAEAAEAHRQLEGRATTGKVLLIP
jgi:NADPH2:quinone reductase